MRFLVDANLSPRLAEHLTRAGHDAVHVADAGLLTASDAEILRRAEEDHRIVLSSDTDFGALLARHEASSPSFILLRHLNDRKHDELAALLLANLPAVAADLERGAVVTVTPRHLRVRTLPIAPAG